MGAIATSGGGGGACHSVAHARGWSQASRTKLLSEVGTYCVTRLSITHSGTFIAARIADACARNSKFEIFDRGSDDNLAPKYEDRRWLVVDRGSDDNLAPKYEDRRWLVVVTM